MDHTIIVANNDTRSTTSRPRRNLSSAPTVTGTASSQDGSDDNDNQDSLTRFLNDYDVVNGPERPIHPIQTEFDSNSESPRPRVRVRKDIDAVDVDDDHEQGTKVSPRTPYIRICPPANCKEKIIICLDLNEEMESTCFRSRAGDKYTSLDLAKRAIKMFVMHKSQMNSDHEFALVIFHDECTMIQNFSSKPEAILQTLYDNEMMTQPSGPLDLDLLYRTIEENVQLPRLTDNPQVIPPPYVVRLLLLYGRSQSIPIGQGKQAQRMLEASPCFFTDVLYIHQPVSEDNSCEGIFNRLCELDPIGLSYILEASKYTPIFNSAAKLLAHPLQRPIQDKASYKIGSLPTVPDIDERTIANY